MASKHLRKKHARSRVGFAVTASALAVVAVALTLALTAHIVDGNPTAAHDATAAPAAMQPLSQEGRLVAVTPTSLTALSVDGFARTYLIDAQTNAITAHGSSVGGAAKTFAVDDEVAIVGVVRDGTAVATAVAAKQVANLDGPPMDAL